MMKDLHVNQQVCLKHEFVDFPSLAHNLFATLGQQKKPAIDDGVGSLNNLWGVLNCCNLWCGRYCQCGTSYGTDKVGKG